MGTTHLLRLLSLFTGLSVLQQVRSRKLTVLQTVYAVEGSCVVVPCQTEKYERVIWYQYHSINYPVVFDGIKPNTVEAQFRGRTSVPGKATEGNCSLKIDKVRQADNNLTIYVWINPDSEKLNLQTVTIKVERKTPQISIQNEIVEGQIFQAHCRVNFACPDSPPKIRWHMNQLLENSSYTGFSEPVQGLWLYTETLRGIATYEMHKGYISCSADFGTITTNSQQLTFNIFYKPVTVTLVQEKKPVLEGNEVIMDCAAECNPSPHTYSWLRREMGQNHEINSTQRNITFSNITRHTSVSCIAHNDIGAGQSEWLPINVQFAPDILPSSDCDKPTGHINCSCETVGNPSPTLHWYVDGLPVNHSDKFTISSQSVNGTSLRSIMIVDHLQEKDLPTVVCRSTNSLGSASQTFCVHSAEDQTFQVVPWAVAGVSLTGNVFAIICIILIWKARQNVKPKEEDSTYISLDRRDKSPEYDVIGQTPR